MSSYHADMPLSPLTNRVYVVLVEPGNSLNIGAVARAMSNLGFQNLILVAPSNFDRAKANLSACWATDVLDRVQVYADLDSAVRDMDQVVGFSTRHGANRPRHLLLPQWGGRMAADRPARLALLFGSEDHGLRLQHLAHCRWLVRIPSFVENPSFNIAQAVLLALAELSRPQWLGLSSVPRVRPTQGEFMQLDRLVTASLIQSGYFGKGTPRPVPRIVRGLLRRIDPDKREMGILMGMFGKLHRVLAGKVPVHPVDLEAAGLEAAALEAGLDAAELEAGVLESGSAETAKRGERVKE